MAAAVLVVAVACTATAWLRPVEELTAADAVAVARSALAAGGVEATIDPAPGSGTYTTSGGEVVAVWKVLAEVRGGRVAIWIARDDGRPVFLDDRAPGGAGQVLADSTVVAIRDHRGNPAFDRHLRANLAITGAAAALAVVGVQVSARLPVAGRRRTRGSTTTAPEGG